MAWDRGCDIILNSVLKVKPREKVVIVADDGSQVIGEALAERARSSGLDASLCLMTVRTKPGEEPPAPIAAALREADCGILAVTTSITHSRARHEAIKAGARVASIPGACPRMFEDGSLEADISVIGPLGEWVAERITEGKTVEIRSARGTNLRLSIDGRLGGGSFGSADRPGGFTVIPCLEATVGPVEWSAEGVIVVDGAVVPGGLVRHPFEVVLERGTITSIKGGEEAQRLKEMLASYGDPNVYHLAELGIGLNPRAEMGHDIPAEDEGVYGTIHFGFGEGRSFGSSITACTHTDLVIAEGQLAVDNEILLDRRVFATAM